MCLASAADDILTLSNPACAELAIRYPSTRTSGTVASSFVFGDLAHPRMGYQRPATYLSWHC